MSIADASTGHRTASIVGHEIVSRKRLSGYVYDKRLCKIGICLCLNGFSADT